MTVKNVSDMRFASKVEWEGGITDALDYGLDTDESNSPDLQAMWDHTKTAYAAFYVHLTAMQGFLDATYDEDDNDE